MFSTWVVGADKMARPNHPVSKNIHIQGQPRKTMKYHGNTLKNNETTLKYNTNTNANTNANINTNKNKNQLFSTWVVGADKMAQPNHPLSRDILCYKTRRGGRKKEK